MPNIIAALVFIGAVFFIARFVIRNRNKPELKLLRDFRKLQKSILKSIGKENRVEAKKLLLECDEHLISLLTAREQQLVLADMRKSAHELTGTEHDTRTSIVEDDLPRKLSEFFGSLTRISTVVSLGSDETMSQLRSFATDLEIQQESINEVFSE